MFSARQGHEQNSQSRLQTGTPSHLVEQEPADSPSSSPRPKPSIVHGNKAHSLGTRTPHPKPQSLKP